MFSRLFRRALEVQHPFFMKHQPLAAIKTAPAMSATVSEKKSSSAESSQRDLINFPRMVRAEYPPPSRHLGIPEHWFQFLYPKTGFTGPYVLAFGFTTFLLSKEYLLDHHFSTIVVFFTFITIVKNKFGDKIGETYNNLFEENAYELDKSQILHKKHVKDQIETLQKSLYPEIMIDEITKAKKENVLLQMESIYRERLTEVYKKVKKSLDFQLEMENAERRVLQKNLSDYVIKNVLNSITPELEKNTMQTCIKNLNLLAAKN